MNQPADVHQQIQSLQNRVSTLEAENQKLRTENQLLQSSIANLNQYLQDLSELHANNASVLTVIRGVRSFLPRAQQQK